MAASLELRHFHMFGMFTPYGGTAPLNIGGRPGP
jgi:hypothetical protein